MCETFGVPVPLAARAHRLSRVRPQTSGAPVSSSDTHETPDCGRSGASTGRTERPAAGTRRGVHSSTTGVTPTSRDCTCASWWVPPDRTGKGVVSFGT